MYMPTYKWSVLITYAVFLGPCQIILVYILFIHVDSTDMAEWVMAKYKKMFTLKLK